MGSHSTFVAQCTNDGFAFHTGRCSNVNSAPEVAIHFGANERRLGGRGVLPSDECRKRFEVLPYVHFLPVRCRDIDHYLFRRSSCRIGKKGSSFPLSKGLLSHHHGVASFRQCEVH